MTAWKSIFSRYHLIIVQDPDLKGDLQIPEGFDVDVYTKSHIDKVVGNSSSIAFSGYSCKYFGFLMSRKKYVVSTKDPDGFLVDPVAQHVRNLATPATPFFFNTLYDPYREGADFVRGYPFSLRSGVPCALSCGLWLNLADMDAPTQALKPENRNSRYVDAVMTVPTKAMMPISGINIAFNRELVGPALCPALKLAGEGKVRWETMEDIWSGSGLPYVWRNERGNAIESLKKEWECVKLMEEVVPCFQSMILPEKATKAEDCVTEMAKRVKKQLGGSHPGFGRAADAMLDWVELWNTFGSGPSPV
ncbi:Probable UDP-arabinopyranose mutase 5 [Linum grandiflorum]